MQLVRQRDQASNNTDFSSGSALRVKDFESDLSSALEVQQIDVQSIATAAVLRCTSPPSTFAEGKLLVTTELG